MCEVKIKEYLSYFNKTKYPALFSDECCERLENIRAVYGDLETNETILEILLDKEDLGCDYSIRMATGKERVSEYWYELDYGAYIDTNIGESYFIDASGLRPGVDNSDFYAHILPTFAGEERSNNLLSMLKIAVDGLQGKCKALYQLGAMTARGQEDSLRVFTDDMKKEDILDYLKMLLWSGNFEKLESILTEYEKLSDKRKFILDFDLFEDHISKQIGINFGTPNKRYETVECLLNRFEANGLCLSDKKRDVLRWILSYPSHTPFILNDISHFKIPFDGQNILAVKAYLRQGSVIRHLEYRAYDTPYQMNLELTTRCPLRCPQCYCDLTKGKDLSLDEAIYWLEEAARSNVCSINLSGGETLVYPHLTSLIAKCHELGLESNIAVSGYGVTRKKIQELLDAGLDHIYVSLNGSTEGINKKTRDGYTLAISTLQLLKDMSFEYVYINWVMHECNADDFSEMIRLAENYNVKELVVMVFKPDSSHQLPNVPSEVQMRAVAKQIKQYKGNLKIGIESCFSQMRALVGERFFINTNQGINRGCGAGRDGISINVDGKITPCRHLEFPEETRSIRDYWANSKIISKLREMEDHMESPCGECRYHYNCLPCAAVNVKLHGNISMGIKECVL